MRSYILAVLMVLLGSPFPVNGDCQDHLSSSPPVEEQLENFALELRVKERQLNDVLYLADTRHVYQRSYALTHHNAFFYAAWNKVRAYMRGEYFHVDKLNPIAYQQELEDLEDHLLVVLEFDLWLKKLAVMYNLASDHKIRQFTDPRLPFVNRLRIMDGVYWKANDRLLNEYLRRFSDEQHSLYNARKTFIFFKKLQTPDSLRRLRRTIIGEQRQLSEAWNRIVDRLSQNPYHQYLSDAAESIRLQVERESGDNFQKNVGFGAHKPYTAIEYVNYYMVYFKDLSDAFYSRQELLRLLPEEP